MRRLNVEKDLWIRGADWPSVYSARIIQKFEYETSLNLYPAMINKNPRLAPFEYSDPYPDWYKKYLNNL